VHAKGEKGRCGQVGIHAFKGACEKSSGIAIGRWSSGRKQIIPMGKKPDVPDVGPLNLRERAENPPASKDNRLGTLSSS